MLLFFMAFLVPFPTDIPSMCFILIHQLMRDLLNDTIFSPSAHSKNLQRFLSVCPSVLELSSLGDSLKPKSEHLLDL